MKRHLALLAGCLLLCLGGLGVILASREGAAPAPVAKDGGEAAPKIATSRIAHVTIYPDSALITREVDVPAGAGLVELVVNPLPEATVASSLYTESVEGLRVLTTRFRSRPVKEDTREEVRKLDEELRKLQAQQRKLQSESQAIEANLALMAKLENFATASTTHATEKGKLDADATIALAKYLMEGRTERAKQKVELFEQQQLLMEQIDFAQRKLRTLTSGSNKIERDAVIVVDKVNAGGGKIKLNYLVTSAVWKPAYKFRAGKTAKDAVTVEYLAAVIQQTGEDWHRVEMTLSTAQPMLNAAPPDLHALAINVLPRGGTAQGVTVGSLQQGLGLRAGGGMGSGGPMAPGTMPPGGMPGMSGPLPAGRLAVQAAGLAESKDKGKELAEAAKKLRWEAQDRQNTLREKDATELSNYAAVLEQMREMLVAQGSKKEGGIATRTGNEGPSVTYHLSAKLSVPSRSDEQVIEVSKLDLEPEYFYKAVPVLTSHVYRQATLQNKSKHVLLPGEATMYNGTDFVGRMTLPLVAVGEKFTVGFGADTQLQVQRQMMDRSKTMQAGNQVLKYDYRILVSSYKSEKVKVQVWDLCRSPRRSR